MHMGEAPNRVCLAHSPLGAPRPCASAAGEHARIQEWVAYHWSIGVGKFYLYDDQSSPPLEGVLADLIRAGVVRRGQGDAAAGCATVLHVVPSCTSPARRLSPPRLAADWARTAPPQVHYRFLAKPLGRPHQLAAYADCLEQHSREHSWLGGCLGKGVLVAVARERIPASAALRCGGVVAAHKTLAGAILACLQASSTRTSSSSFATGPPTCRPFWSGASTPGSRASRSLSPLDARCRRGPGALSCGLP